MGTLLTLLSSFLFLFPLSPPMTSQMLDESSRILVPFGTRVLVSALALNNQVSNQSTAQIFSTFSPFLSSSAR